jgi:hypothetical protein
VVLEDVVVFVVPEVWQHSHISNLLFNVLELVECVAGRSDPAIRVLDLDLAFFTERGRN